MSFQFEKLDVYKKSLEWVEEAEGLCEAAKGKVSYNFLDQLSRASLSIPLNIAEGNGRWHKGDKKQFFWIARGSVFECVPILQVLQRKGIVEEAQYTECYGQLDVIAKMLTNLVKSVEKLNR